MVKRKAATAAAVRAPPASIQAAVASLAEATAASRASAVRAAITTPAAATAAIAAATAAPQAAATAKQVAFATKAADSAALEAATATKKAGVAAPGAVLPVGLALTAAPPAVDALLTREGICAIRNSSAAPAVPAAAAAARLAVAYAAAEAAPGPDGINPRLLKELGDSILTPLEIIFQKSLTSGMVPLEWRQATVILIFKKVSKRETGNYRPVSLTSIPCKILESILKDDIMEHLLLNGLIKDSQQGFKPGRSCTTNLITFLEKATLAKNNGKPIDVVYLDFSKAFDKVPHRRLLRKMEGKKISKEVIKWIENWLTGRTQRVKVNGGMSEEGEVDSGVPQGTVLGPCLFTIFIDDTDDCAVGKTLIIKFADDIKGLRTVERDEDAQELQETLDNLCEWATNWGMCFNVEKCKIMHIGHNNIQREYKMGGQTLAKTEMEKDVGVCVNRGLKPSDHCKKNSHESDSCAETNTKELSLQRQKSVCWPLQEICETSP